VRCNIADCSVVYLFNSEWSSQWDPDALPPDVSKEDEELFIKVQKVNTAKHVDND
jgi:hypothetical protein